MPLIDLSQFKKALRKVESEPVRCEIVNAKTFLQCTRMASGRVKARCEACEHIWRDMAACTECRDMAKRKTGECQCGGRVRIVEVNSVAG